MEAALRRSTGVGVAFFLVKRYTINDLERAPGTNSLSALDVFTFSRGVYLISIQASDLNEPGLGVGPTLHYVVYHAARRLLVGYPEVLVVHFILSAHYLLLTTFCLLLTHPPPHHHSTVTHERADDESARAHLTRHWHNLHTGGGGHRA